MQMKSSALARVAGVFVGRRKVAWKNVGSGSGSTNGKTSKRERKEKKKRENLRSLFAFSLERHTRTEARDSRASGGAGAAALHCRDVFKAQEPVRA